MTPGQQQDAERHIAYIEREGLSSVMNLTKWREVRTIIMSMFGPNVWFRTKEVRGEEPPTPSSWWECDFAHHLPTSYETIEWLEIDPVLSERRGEAGPDFNVAFTASLAAKNIPFHVEGNVIRIQGYIRTQ